MNIELNFRKLKDNENINLIFYENQNGYYLDSKNNIVYELVSSIGGTGSGYAIQYKYDASDLSKCYMYRISDYDGTMINWSEWINHIIRKENNEFSYTENEKTKLEGLRNDTSKLNEYKNYRNHFFDELIPKKLFYPSNDLDESSKVMDNKYGGILLSSLKNFGMVNIDFTKNGNNYIDIKLGDINNDYFKKLIKKYPDNEEMIRKNINGIFIIPKNTYINIPCIKSHYLSTSDSNINYSQTAFTGEASYTSTSDGYYKTSDNNSILIIESNYIKKYNTWERHYLYLSINESIFYDKDFYIDNNPSPNTLHYGIIHNKSKDEIIRTSIPPYIWRNTVNVSFDNMENIINFLGGD